MDIDKIISIIRNLKEDGGAAGSGMVANAPGTSGGFSGSADSKGPAAGFDPVMNKMMRKKYATGGVNSRKTWLDHLKKSK
jgi:hypothetical protein